MTDDLQALDGVGPAREESLQEQGYETYIDLAEADHEVLADEIKNLSKDTALELVVQAQNEVDMEEADVTENPNIESESDDGESDGSGDVEDNATEEEGPYDVVLSFESGYEYDSFYHTLLEQRCTLHRTNRQGVDLYETMLDRMRGNSYDSELQVKLTEGELNDLHNAVLEQRIEYQGENLIDYMDALKRVEERVNSVREEFLF